MLSGVLHPLWPSVAVGGSAGPRGRSAALWAVWWVGGVGCSGLSRNYYQLQLAAVSLRSPFGYTEAAIEGGLAAGAALAAVAPPPLREHSWSLLLGSTLSAAALYLACARGAAAGSLPLVVGGNVLSAALFGFQRATGAASLAAALPERRDALLFALLSFAALGAASLLQAAGAAARLDAGGYYLLCAAAQLPLPAAMLTRWAVRAVRARRRRAPEAAGGSAHT
ncbi:hypothetical protein EMIHUDRAFT_438315 [Emiliania huxleyi CCMP1516]|uniref:Uncharacterized protein n=2 Tax=Emiliania huxleyi TaxID=2903 RepID=A0A0D3IAU9_EMIH1|nr:hypothetical protein EMIHUDRAFT_438315 [Emiliania huxleyi CCMP1516]EOD08384.1 hypothetical protein EMIHUDRAFT_438315 [Emiliania huxleyi CCMP1516]|eukprot:XP_005760813.1 hypothetical protein EMIHUDRAFT_438315 [Emiliania huxleyi CCMP1516]